MWLCFLWLVWGAPPVAMAYQVAFFGEPQQQSIIDMYLYRGSGEQGFRRRIDGAVEARLAMISDICQIDESRRKKLEFAAKGDLARFYREVDRIAEETKHLDVRNQAEMQEAWQKVSPVYQRSRTCILDENSLLTRLLPKLLSEEQRERYDAYMTRKQERRRKTAVKIAISEIERSMPLTAEQRDALLKLLLEHPLPKKVPEGYEPFLGFIFLCRAEADALSKIFDEKEMTVIQQYRTQYAGYQGAVTW